MSLGTCTTVCGGGVIERPHWLVKSVHIDVLNKVVSRNSLLWKFSFFLLIKELAITRPWEEKERGKNAALSWNCSRQPKDPPPTRRVGGVYNRILITHNGFHIRLTQSVKEIKCKSLSNPNLVPNIIFLFHRTGIKNTSSEFCKLVKFHYHKPNLESSLVITNSSTLNKLLWLSIYRDSRSFQTSTRLIDSSSMTYQPVVGKLKPENILSL